MNILYLKLDALNEKFVGCLPLEERKHPFRYQIKVDVLCEVKVLCGRRKSMRKKNTC